MSENTPNPSVLEAVRETGALLEGHFQLASGVHSDRYLEKFNLLQWPGHTEDACRPLAAAARELAPSTIVGPTTGGVILAYEVARQLSLRGIIAERNPEGEGRRIQRDFRLEPGERVFVVDDVLTSGGSVRDTIEAVRIAGGEPVAVGVLVDRSAGRVAFEGLPLHASMVLDLATYQPDDCLLCRDGMALTVT
ncbi:MAG: orotate phosphoribosyltransferase [Chloroflexi bacterium]|nr:orotate phosphoribosyltransferase [Chloroflexota bacterium]